MLCSKRSLQYSPSQRYPQPVFLDRLLHWGARGPTMSTATLLNGVSINGIGPSGTFLKLSLLTVL